jgi:hypothetical protein
MAMSSGLAVDGAGNLFIADGDQLTGNTVRKVVIATGAVTTLAGMAAVGGSEDGIGAAAHFGYPIGIASDGAGTLYVADIWSNTIRKVVVATRAVTTLAGAIDQTAASATGAAAPFTSRRHRQRRAGNSSRRQLGPPSGGRRRDRPSHVRGRREGSADGLGAAASFALPSGIAADGQGNSLRHRPGNNTIRKVVIATGVVTTLAGGASPSPARLPGTGPPPASVGGHRQRRGRQPLRHHEQHRKIVIAATRVVPRSRARPTGAPAWMESAPLPFAWSASRAWGGQRLRRRHRHQHHRKIVIAPAPHHVGGRGRRPAASTEPGAVARFRPNASPATGRAIRRRRRRHDPEIAIGAATVSPSHRIAGRMGVRRTAPGGAQLLYGLSCCPGELAIVDTVENSVLIGHF